ncbi:hypothetical protein HDV00_009281 [Rhizophlyctis rosea]|nr:hypothetical protein HDV00_009281 [Rhizophlyctis rosea]
MEFNDDCWTLVLAQVAKISLSELLNCLTVNRHFHQLVERHPYWTTVGKHLNVGPPKPRARKYKTWKSLVLQKRGRFCERCMRKRLGERKLHIYTCRRWIVVFVCVGCLNEYQPVERHRARLAKGDDLRRELRKYSIFSNCNMELVLRDNNLLPEARYWLGRDDVTTTTYAIARKMAEHAGRQALVTARFAAESEEGAVVKWVASGVGNIEEIVRVVRARWERQALVTARFAVESAEGTVVRHISYNIGDVDEVVACMREMDWYFRCTG